MFVQSFTARMPLLMADIAFILGRRHWSTPRQCYLHCHRTVSGGNKLRKTGSRSFTWKTATRTEATIAVVHEESWHWMSEFIAGSGNSVVNFYRIMCFVILQACWWFSFFSAVLPIVLGLKTGCNALMCCVSCNSFRCSAFVSEPTFVTSRECLWASSLGSRQHYW